jgi:hypothetical protein
MAGMVAHPGDLLDHASDAGKGPVDGVEAMRTGTLEQRLLDLGELGGRQLGIRAGGTAAAQGVHTALLEAGVPDMGALAADTELMGDLGPGTALGEQFSGTKAAGLAGGTLLGSTGAAGGRHRRTLTHHQPSRQPNPRNSK